MSGQVPTIALAFNDVSLTRAKHNNIHVHQSIVTKHTYTHEVYSY